MPLRILYLETEDLNRRLTENFLTDQGHEVTEVTTTKAALDRLINSEQFDLAILSHYKWDKAADAGALSFEVKENLGIPIILVVNIDVPESHAAQEVLHKPYKLSKLGILIAQLAPVTT